MPFTTAIVESYSAVAQRVWPKSHRNWAADEWCHMPHLASTAIVLHVQLLSKVFVITKGCGQRMYNAVWLAVQNSKGLVRD